MTEPSVSSETTYLSTVQVAKAVGVSVTTIKRRVDDGVLPAHRTAGGHRKLILADVLRVLRDRGLPDADPSQLTQLPGDGEADPQRIRSQLAEAIANVDGPRIRTILRAAHRAGLTISRLADDVISPTLQLVGEMWQHGRIDVSQEHLITQSIVGAMYEVRSAMMATLAKDRPVAIGGAPEHDHYILPTLLAKLTLVESGWQAINIGPHTPTSAFLTAIDRLKPQLIWLSVSHVENVEQFQRDCELLYRTAQSRGIPLAIGGRALTAELRTRLPYTTYGDRFEQLASFARTLKPPPARPKRGRPRVQS